MQTRNTTFCHVKHNGCLAVYRVLKLSMRKIVCTNILINYLLIMCLYQLIFFSFITHELFMANTVFRTRSLTNKHHRFVLLGRTHVNQAPFALVSIALSEPELFYIRCFRTNYETLIFVGVTYMQSQGAFQFCWTPNCTEIIILALFSESLTLVGANESLVIDFRASKGL